MTEPLHIALIKAQVSHQQVCREAFQKLDLTEGQPKVLIRLLYTEGMLQKDLSAKCGVKPATMTSLLQNMLSKGLIERKSILVSGGKRAYRITLTDIGREKATQVAEIMNQVEEVCYRGFSDKEKKRLIEYLNRLEDNLKQSTY